MIDLLEQVNAAIENEWKYVSQSINHNDKKITSKLFEECVEIKCDPKNIPEGRQLIGKKGIYVFLINEPLALSKAEVSRFNSLKGAKIKGNAGFDVNEGFCLYAGSTISESLYSRIRQHFRADFDGNSLHLAAPERCLLLGKVTAYVFPIKKQYEPYIKIIMPALETKLHEDYMPLAGSPRT